MTPKNKPVLATIRKSISGKLNCKKIKEKVATKLFISKPVVATKRNNINCCADFFLFFELKTHLLFQKKLLLDATKNAIALKRE